MVRLRTTVARLVDDIDAMREGAPPPASSTNGEPAEDDRTWMVMGPRASSKTPGEVEAEREKLP